MQFVRQPQDEQSKAAWSPVSEPRRSDMSPLSSRRMSDRHLGTPKTPVGHRFGRLIQTIMLASGPTYVWISGAERLMGRVGGRRGTSHDALFHPPPAEPYVQVSKPTALQSPDSQEVGWMCRDHRRIRPAAEPHPRHLASRAPYRSGLPAPLGHVVGFPDLRLLRGLRHPRARAP